MEGQARKELRAGLSPRSQFHQPPLGAPSRAPGLLVQFGCPTSTIRPTARPSREPRKGPFLGARLVQTSPRRPWDSEQASSSPWADGGHRPSAQRRGGGDQQLVRTRPRHWSACSPPLAAGGPRDPLSFAPRASLPVTARSLPVTASQPPRFRDFIPGMRPISAPRSPQLPPSLRTGKGQVLKRLQSPDSPLSLHHRPPPPSQPITASLSVRRAGIRYVTARRTNEEESSLALQRR